MALFSYSGRTAVFNPETYTLSNGMQVVVVTNRSAPAVVHMVWYKVGAADEPRGQSGIAHFLEHLMFKGTKYTPPGEFSKIVARNGGTDNNSKIWKFIQQIIPGVTSRGYRGERDPNLI